MFYLIKPLGQFVTLLIRADSEESMASKYKNYCYEESAKFTLHGTYESCSDIRGTVGVASTVKECLYLKSMMDSTDVADITHRTPGFSNLDDKMRTPSNQLPIVITSPGLYLTRGGKNVRIHDTEDHSEDLSVTRFNCKGNILNDRPKKDVYSIWHQSGQWQAIDQHDNDILARVGE